MQGKLIFFIQLEICISLRKGYVTSSALGSVVTYIIQ